MFLEQRDAVSVLIVAVASPPAAAGGRHAADGLCPRGRTRGDRCRPLVRIVGCVGVGRTRFRQRLRRVAHVQCRRHCCVLLARRRRRRRGSVLALWHWQPACRSEHKDRIVGGCTRGGCQRRDCLAMCEGTEQLADGTDHRPGSKWSHSRRISAIPRLRVRRPCRCLPCG